MYVYSIALYIVLSVIGESSIIAFTCTFRLHRTVLKTDKTFIIIHMMVIFLMNIYIE